MKIQQFKMQREGTFTTSHFTDNQCKEKGHLMYNYKVVIICGPKLDKDNFIIDHIHIDEIVQKTVKKMDSCEKLCINIERALYKLLQTKPNINLISMSVNIIPQGIDVKAHMELITTY